MTEKRLWEEKVAMVSDPAAQACPGRLILPPSPAPYRGLPALKSRWTLC